MMDGNTLAERLALLEPQIEDWHCLLCIVMVRLLFQFLHNDEHTFPLQMVWKMFYCQSSHNHGTLGDFRSKLNCTSVTSEPKKDVNTSLDFLLTVVKVHLLAAARQILHVQNSESSLDLPPVRDADQQSEFINSIARDIVNKYTLIGSAYTSEGVLETNDDVVNYATILCHYDALAEGDGERIYRCWKLFLPHFLATGRRKYSLQALHLQFQVEADLSLTLHTTYSGIAL